MTERNARIIEAAATGVGGGALAGIVLQLIFSSTVLTAIGGAVGLANGAVSGYTGIYAWRQVSGWLSFLLDSTWALFGTTLGLVVIHLTNALWKPLGKVFKSIFNEDPTYRRDLCQRKDFHLYEHGMALGKGFAFTQGNVTSNGKTKYRGPIEERLDFLINHERFHVIQSRMFGPLFQLTYVVWFTVGSIVGAVLYFAVGRSRGDGKLKDYVQTVGYYDNPFEYWAYNNDGNWHPRGITAKSVAWPDRKPPKT